MLATIVKVSYKGFMNIKQQTSQAAIDAFLAKGGKVKKCPTAVAAATPLRTLRKRDAIAAEHGQSGILARRGGALIDPAQEERDYLASENEAERRMERAAEDRYERLFG